MESTTTAEAHVPRFARGFVLSENQVAPPVPGWSSEMALGLHLTRAPEVSVTQAEHGGSSVVVLGHLIDTAHWLPQPAAVTAAAEALARSETEFLDLTDAWSGRYLLVYGDATSRHVMTDASGVRSAYHALGGPFVLATHARLVANIVEAPVSPMADAYRAEKRARRILVMPMPGRSTPWTGVVALTPNVSLGVESHRLRRIFPRGELPTMDPRTAASAIGPRLRGQVGALVASGRPIELSITAGRDSRVSLAASRPWHDQIGYFTYARTRHTRNDWDATTASSMAAELGLSHRVVEVSEADATPELTAAMAEATTISHGKAIVGAYRRTFPADTIHIRSSIAEIARSYYRRKASGRALDPSPRALTPDIITRLWAAHGIPAAPIVVEAFDEWMQAIHFADIEGLDGLDVLYWDHVGVLARQRGPGERLRVRHPRALQCPDHPARHAGRARGGARSLDGLRAARRGPLAGARTVAAQGPRDGGPKGARCSHRCGRNPPSVPSLAGPLTTFDQGPVLGRRVAASGHCSSSSWTAPAAGLPGPSSSIACPASKAVAEELREHLWSRQSSIDRRSARHATWILAGLGQDPEASRRSLTSVRHPHARSPLAALDTITS